MKILLYCCRVSLILPIFIQRVDLLPTRKNLVKSNVESNQPANIQNSQPAPVQNNQPAPVQNSQPAPVQNNQPTGGQQLPTRKLTGETDNVKPVENSKTVDNSKPADNLSKQVQTSSSTGTQASNFETSLILGNQFTSKAEIYQLSFKCSSNGCNPIPLQDDDLLWSSPETPGISEVKYVIYNGQPAILCTTQNGAIVYAYPSGTVLFHKEMETSFYINVHSAEVLPDGNVIVAGSMSDGIFVVLYPDGANVNQAQADSVSAKAPFGHGLVYDKTRSRLYAVGYLTFLALQYSSGTDKRGSLTVLKTVPLSNIYDEANKNEDANVEDGAHDLYPVDGSADTLWLTTGEHVFQINVNVSLLKHVFTR